jgi:hypothetical protein
MKLDCAGDVSLSTYLKSSKTNLYQYYEIHYETLNAFTSDQSCAVHQLVLQPLLVPLKRVF